MVFLFISELKIRQKDNSMFCFLTRRSDYMAVCDKGLVDIECVFLS